MQHPGQALSDVDTKVLEAVHPLHRGPVDIKGGICICDLAHHSCVVCKLDDGVVVKVMTQSCVYKTYSRGLKTQPWGAPLLNMMVEDHLHLGSACQEVKDPHAQWFLIPGSQALSRE